MVYLRDYIAVVRKHDFLIIVSFLLIFGSALIVSLYMPRVYEASAVIEIQASAQARGLSGLMQNFVSGGFDQVSLETVCRRLTSNSLLYEVIRNLKANSFPLSDHLEDPNALAPRIIAKPIPDTRMIQVAVRMRADEGRSESAAKVANELIHAIQRQRGMKMNSGVMRRQKFLDDKIKTVESEIDLSDQNMRQIFKSKGNTLIWSAYLGNILSRLSELDKIRQMNESLLTAERKKIQELENTLKSEPDFVEYSKTLARNPLWDKYRSSLVDLELQLVSARATELGSGNPTVKALEAQIENVLEKMRSLGQEEISSRMESFNPVRQAILNQLVEANLNVIYYEIELENIKRLIEQLNKERDLLFRNIPEDQFLIDKSLREIEYKVAIYKSLLEKRLESELLALENKDEEFGVRGGIEIVDLAEPNVKAIKPRVKFICGIAAIVGTFVGLALAFVSEYFSTIGINFKSS